MTVRNTFGTNVGTPGTNRILGISGSLREGSYSTTLLRAVQSVRSTDTVVTLQTLHGIPLYNEDLDVAPGIASVAALREAITTHDGVVIATPEYNHGIPGVLKNALDWASRPAFASCFRDKPVLILSSSPGTLGGVRAQAQLRETLASMLARVVPHREIVIPDVGSRVQGRELVDQPLLAKLSAGLESLLSELHLQARSRDAS